MGEFRPSRPGERRGGRKKGQLGAPTVALKEAILLAAEEAGGDGGLVGYLRKLATSDPRSFVTLLGKVIPLSQVITTDNVMRIEGGLPPMQTEADAPKP